MLRWQQDWGAKQEFWEAKILAGQRAPEPFYERPDLDPVSLFYWAAFVDLASERQSGMGMGPIPRSKAKDYAAEYGIGEDAFDRFWLIIHLVDTEQLKIANTTDKDRQVVSDDKPRRDKTHLLQKRAKPKNA